MYAKMSFRPGVSWLFMRRPFLSLSSSHLQHTRYNHQTLSEQRQTNNLSSQSRTIAIFAMLLFAFAGLISGFAVGTFTRPGSHPQTTNQIAGATPPITSRNMTPTPTPHLEHPISL